MQVNSILITKWFKKNKIQKLKQSNQGNQFNQWSFLISVVSLFTLQTATAQTDPMIIKWWFNTTNQTYTGTKGTFLVDVEAVYYSTTKVYVKCSGVPNYYADGKTKFDAKDGTNIFVLPRTQTPATTKKYLRDEGNIGMLIDGSLIFSPCDGKSYNSAGVWHQIAYAFEGLDFDSSNGHSTPTNTYHHHVDATKTYTKNSAAHSPIIGYSFDGYPIYGPYGYSIATDTSSAIKRIVSSWAVRNITTRTTLPDGSTASSAGPAITAQALGKYFEDYTYTVGSGDLDRSNGRFCKTPEYPTGTYAYFTTVDAALKPAFPYFIGDSLYGAQQTGNTGPQAGNGTVPTGTTQYNPTLPVTLKYFTATSQNCNAQLQWQTAQEINAKHFIVEYSKEGKSFKSIATIECKGSGNNYSFTHNLQEVQSPPLGGLGAFYRLKVVDKDGRFAYSNIVSVTANCFIDNIKIYPTFTTSNITVSINNNHKHTVLLYNTQGKIISKQIVSNTVNIDVSSLIKGMYVVSVEDIETKEGVMQKIIKE